MQLHHCFMDSPVGEITLLANAEGLLGVWFETYTTLAKDLGEFSTEHSVLKLTMVQLSEYLVLDLHLKRGFVQY